MKCIYKPCDERPLDECLLDYCYSLCYPEQPGTCQIHFTEEFLYDYDCNSFIDEDWQLDCESEQASVCESRPCNDHVSEDVCHLDHCFNMCYRD